MMFKPASTFLSVINIECSGQQKVFNKMVRFIEVLLMNI